jgi:hypothetical protein
VGKQYHVANGLFIREEHDKSIDSNPDSRGRETIELLGAETPDSLGIRPSPPIFAEAQVSELTPNFSRVF